MTETPQQVFDVKDPDKPMIAVSEDAARVTTFFVRVFLCFAVTGLCIFAGSVAACGLILPAVLAWLTSGLLLLVLLITWVK